MTDINAIIQKVKQKKEEEKKAKELEKNPAPILSPVESKVETSEKPIEKKEDKPISEQLKDDGIFRNELLVQLVIMNKNLEELKNGLAFLLSGNE
jgi:hypothetical protein